MTDTSEVTKQTRKRHKQAFPGAVVFVRNSRGAGTAASRTAASRAAWTSVFTRTGAIIAAAAITIALGTVAGACGVLPARSPSRSNDQATVAGRSATWSTAPECDDPGRPCPAATIYRLTIEDADGSQHMLRVDAAVYGACSRGELFPDCAQEASS
jgi:hypothetical protein